MPLPRLIGVGSEEVPAGASSFSAGGSSSFSFPLGGLEQGNGVQGTWALGASRLWVSEFRAPGATQVLTEVRKCAKVSN